MTKQKRSKKGQVSGIAGSFYALMFMSIAIIVTIIISAFGTDYTNSKQDDFGVAACAASGGTYTSYNSTSKLCYNSSGSTTTVPGHSFNITGLGVDDLGTLAGGTGDVTDVSIIVIVLTLLISLIGVFAGISYLRR